VWTPRRVLLLAAGVVLFIAAYVAYAHALGGIDGLPALPERYSPRPHGDTPPSRGPSVTPIEERLQQAFGVGCPELKMPIKIESPRGIVVAAKDCVFENGGREVRLTPVSMAIFKAAAKGDPEINTLRGATATLILDQPISGPFDMNNRRIVGAVLHGTGGDKDEQPIIITNNRRTLARDDDIEIRINRGPVYFDDVKRLIHTNDVVEMQDRQSRPEPMKVTATGLDVHLAPSGQPGGRGKPDKPKSDGGSVERIVLLADVDMHLFNEPGSGFPSLGAAPPKPPATGRPKAAPPPRDHIHITTAGPFNYDLTRNLGRFDIPERESQLAPEWVTVVRNPKSDYDEKKEDRLQCQHLELQFRRKPAEPATPGAPPAAEGQGANLETEWVHAWGNKITIESPGEHVYAEGNDLLHQALTHTTVLKGEPEAQLLKDGDQINAHELEMIEHKDRATDKTSQQVTARGRGSIHLIDRATQKRLRHARWTEKFTSTRDGALDVLTFTGNAALVEDEQLLPEDIVSDEKLLACKSFIRSDELQVWLEPPPAEAPPSAKPAAKTPAGPADVGTGGRRPKRLEATGQVIARSPEMRVLDRPGQPTQRLTLIFTDVPDVVGPPAPDAARPGAAPPTPAAPKPAAAPGPEPIVVPAAPAKPEPAKPSRPVDLCASFITAHVLRYEPTGRTEIDTLETEGAVRVVQAPSGDDKGFDIRGDKLEMKKKPAGNHLKVTGDLAELHMDRLVIVGPEVEIDQGDNTATVDGDGYMTMENTTDFQGNPLKKPELLTVHWNKLMRFEGSFAEFHGNIQAEQASSRLTCQTLQVYFDKPVSLSDARSAPKKGQAKGEEPARAKKLICDRSVKVEEETYEVAFRLTDQSFASLSTAGVPAQVIAKLDALKGRNFDTRERFTEALAGVLARDEWTRFQGPVADHASYEPQPRRLAGFKSLDCMELTVWNLERIMSAYGPGVLRIVQPGGDPGAPPGTTGAKPPAKPAKATKPADPQWALTLVTFGRFGDAPGPGGTVSRMDGDNNTHTALFHNDVRVLHVPWSSDPRQMRAPVDMAGLLERLPPGGLYMECKKKLKIYSPEDAPGSAARQELGAGRHVMTGTGDVYVKATDAQGRLFWGTAEEVHYDEEKDQVIFDGKGGLAELNQFERRGEQPKKTRAKRILYSRKDGKVDVDGVAEIQGGSR
jgi:lipopolysaccharide export system protein LptA